MNDMRTAAGVATAALGLAGLACGIVALAADLPFMGLIAGILAVGAGAAGLAASQLPEDSEAREQPTVQAAPATVAASVDDQETGLRSEVYFMAAAGDRIEAARRYLRPVALLMLDISPANGGPVSLPTAGDTLSTTLRDADMVCRRSDNSFAVLLEDTPETGALLVVERLRPALRGRLGDVILRAGVACYPAHGLELESVLNRAESALTEARQSDRDSTEVAPPA
jgi:diguanylate cyclase (GGDEF)-like protein